MREVRRKQKLQWGIEEVSAASTLIFVLLQGPIRAPWNMEAPGSSSHWACSCQNVAAHCCVILSIKAHFLHTGDCAALLTLAQVCCASHILLHRYFNQCKIKPYKFQGICHIFCFRMMFFESWFYILTTQLYLYVQTESSQTISCSKSVSQDSSLHMQGKFPPTLFCRGTKVAKDMQTNQSGCFPYTRIGIDVPRSFPRADPSLWRGLAMQD